MARRLAARLAARLTSRVAVATLLFLVLVADVGNLLATHGEVNTQAAQQRAYQAGQRHEQAEQARESRLLIAKVCNGFGQLAALKPPAGNPATNPSRAFDDTQHATLVGIGADLGCGGSP